LLVGHGTREPLGVAQFLDLARRLAAASPEVALEPCFLELAEPTIAEGLARLLAREIDELIVVPLLLFSAGHAKEDIPTAVAAALEATGRSDLCRGQTAPLACHPELLALSRLRYDEAIAGAPREAPTTLVMIGRGSRDAGATREMHRYAALHAEQVGAANREVGFLAVVRPNLAEVLALAAAASPPRIVVQPHLLFEGLLSAEVRQAVAAARREWPPIDWRCADPLGPHALLVRALRSVCDLRENVRAGAVHVTAGDGSARQCVTGS
jgi:sirohydrochlorin cobaltochelatase